MDWGVFFPGAVQRITHCPNWDPLQRSGTEQGFNCEELPAQMFKLIGSRAFTPRLPADRLCRSFGETPGGSRTGSLLFRSAKPTGSLWALMMACTENNLQLLARQRSSWLNGGHSSKEDPQSHLSLTLYLIVQTIMRPLLTQ